MRKGFTLIELLVVMVIIGILVGMAVPNYMKVKERAKEVQVQAGLHVIQVALERYAVDWEGFYPVFLTGGDQLYNWASMDGGVKNGYYKYGCGYFMISPFANFWPCDMHTDAAWCLQPRVTIGQMEREISGLPAYVANRDVCMDAMLLLGYLLQYPRNPFMRPDIAAGAFGPKSYYSATRPYGTAVAGRYADRMFENSMGDGDVMGTHWWINEVVPWWRRYPVTNNLPGNFYYHPVFCDGFAVAEHQWALVNPDNPYSGSCPGGGSGCCSGCNTAYGRRIKQHGVCGYVLTATTNIYNSGRDASHVACGQAMYFYPYARGASGYFSFEHDPLAVPVSKVSPRGGWLGWTCYSPGGANYQQNQWALPPGDEVGTACKRADRSDCGSGPDGYPDFMLPLLAGGIDKKPQQR